MICYSFDAAIRPPQAQKCQLEPAKSRLTDPGRKFCYLESRLLSKYPYMRLIRSIVRSGINEKMAYQSKRSILIANYLSLILFVALFTILTFRIFLYPDETIQIHWVIGTIVFAGPVILNRLNYTILGRLAVCYGSILFVWYSFIDNMHRVDVLEISQFDGLRIYLLALSFIPYLLFARDHLGMLGLAILPSLLSVLFFDNCFDWLGLTLDPDLVKMSSDYEVMWMRTLVAYLIISAGCITFHSIISHNDEVNRVLMDKIKNNLDKIEEQNRELVIQRNELNDLNSHLGELVEHKTSQIKQQNETLLKLSFTNAHKVRGPVARILGLIKLSRLEDRLDYPRVFELVESETENIDQILHEVSRELDRTVS